MRTIAKLSLLLTAVLTAAVAEAADTANAADAVKAADNTADTINTVNNVDTTDLINTSNIAETADTANTVNIADTANANTAGTIDTVNVNTVNKVNTDTVPRLSGTYWGFGVSLSVGNVPIFPMWQKHFPDSLRHFGLSPTAEDDAGILRYGITESPDAFNFAMPFSISLYNIGEKQVFSFSVSFFSNNKEFQSALSIASDSATRRIDILENLSFYSVSIEAAARLAIPPALFSIDNVQQTFLTMTLGASPINTFTRNREIKTDFDPGDTRMQSAVDSVKRVFPAFSGNGLSVSWRVGISAVKRYPSGYGSELGIFYSGAYCGYFYSNGTRLTEEHIKIRGADLNAENVTNGKPLSFLSNQAEFRATLLVPAKRKNVGD